MPYLLKPVMLLVLSSALTFMSRAQQFATDDAAIVDYLSFQLEAWHGEKSSWILPAVQPMRGLEITPGVGWVLDDGSRKTEYVLQGKYLFREFTDSSLGVGIVAGIGFGRVPQVVGKGIGGAFAYVPLSFAPIENLLLLHTNAGWLFSRRGDIAGDVRHVFTWAIRGDLAIPLAPDRFVLIAELFGDSKTNPQYQIGLRSVAIVDRFSIDLSFGGHTSRNADGAGWALGFAWTPPSFR